MRRLLLMRHAKSDWSVEGQSDHDRSLNARGLRDAPRMGKWLADAVMLPDAVLCSSAQRTRETFAQMVLAWPGTCEVIYHESLYLATPAMLFETIVATPNNAPTLMVLAHNPGISQLASVLSDELIDMPTAAIVVLDCEIDRWSELRQSSEIQLVDIIRPKSL